MPRVEVPPPEPVAFTTELDVRMSDVNYGGHLANDRVLSLAQEARLHWVRSHGFADELDVGGAGLIMADAAIAYASEGKYGMRLRVELGFADVRTRGFDLLYRMADVASGREVARVKTGMLWFDYATRKVVRTPEAFRAILGG
jgi:4-hydroxybenzoyl-CoA thioesterase